MTTLESPIVSLKLLQQTEQEIEEQLQEKPDDTHVRLNLAWCLAMQACVEAGREESRNASGYGSSEGEAECLTIGLGGRSDIASPAASRLLLTHSLRQAGTVMQLTINPQERVEAMRLRMLVSRSGGEQAIVEADAKAGRILANLTQAIQNASGVARASRRKRAPRPE